MAGRGILTFFAERIIIFIITIYDIIFINLLKINVIFYLTAMGRWLNNSSYKCHNLIARELLCCEF